jgi:hypothetical protein
MVIYHYWINLTNLTSDVEEDFMSISEIKNPEPTQCYFCENGGFKGYVPSVNRFIEYRSCEYVFTSIKKIDETYRKRLKSYLILKTINDLKERGLM